MNPLLKELKSHGFKIRYTQPRGLPRDYYVNDSDLEDYIKSDRDGLLTTTEKFGTGYVEIEFMQLKPTVSEFEVEGKSRTEAMIKLTILLLEEGRG